jgi:MFS family permease
MFNAINGMGSMGGLDESTASAANTALYACFAVTGFFAGGIYNLLGPRLTIATGGCTYVLYVGAFLSKSHVTSNSFIILAGALLGVGAALLWTAQGALMMSYPNENEKGRYIAVFWTIFNLGGVVGGLIPFALNYHADETKSAVNDATYVSFMVVMAFGALLGFALVTPEKVRAASGQPAEKPVETDWKQEAWHVLKLFTNTSMLLLMPMFLASNWFYSYQFNGVNGALFNLRTRGLNNVFYWGAQMVGAWFMGKFLDTAYFGVRSKRAITSLAALAILFNGVWAGGYVLQTSYTKESPNPNYDFLDTSGTTVAGPMVLYAVYGLMDAMLQTWCYWVMGALTNDPRQLALYAGFYKGVQSAGGAFSWALDAANLEFLTQLVVSWALFAVACLPAAIVAKRLSNTNTVEEE